MKINVKLPIEGKALRFAPALALAEQPATSIWKVWAEGDELYALSRSSAGAFKISVHASGQIHTRIGPKHKQDFAPLMHLGLGLWFHALEIRFLLSEGARLPTRERESLKNKKAYLIFVPNGFVLIANVLIAVRGAPSDPPLPAEFGGAQLLWRTQLRNGRTAAVITRLVPMDNEKRGRIKYIREELKPTLTFTDRPSDPYIEIHDIHWSDGGNVVNVVPMGDVLRSDACADPLAQK